MTFLSTHPKWGHASDSPFPIRTHQPLYQNPFDLSSGGASLTRTTQEGSFFVNPSLPAYGYGLHRWAFFRTQLHLDNVTSEFAAKAYQEQSSGEPISSDLIANAISSPIHIGHDTAFGYINRFFGLVGFSNVRADVSIRKFGDAGVPQARIRAEGIGGGGLSSSIALGQFLALGVSSKYIEVARVAENLALGDIQSPDTLTSRASEFLRRGQGISHDAALTLQVRSRHLDFRIAGHVQDLGGTSLGPGLAPYPMAYSAGIGMTIHDRDNALHCAADLRDILAVYGEHWTYRAYGGCKLMFFQLFGLGAGLSQGYPSAGAVLNLPFSRLEAGTYTREVGQQVGTEGRTVYFFALGTEW